MDLKECRLVRDLSILNWEETQERGPNDPVLTSIFYFTKAIKACSYVHFKNKVQINDLISIHLKKLEKERQYKPKANRRKDTIKISAEIYEKPEK